MPRFLVLVVPVAHGVEIASLVQVFLPDAMRRASLTPAPVSFSTVVGRLVPANTDRVSGRSAEARTK